MAVITVSRELAALGDETAKELARALRYRFVDKSALEERIKSFGAWSRRLEKYDERKPSFWASLSQDRDDYLHYLKTAVLAEAGEGNCMIMGRGAGFILREAPGVISVFLSAPRDIRLERVKSYFHCDERRARQIIEQNDHDRKGFHRAFFDADWQYPGNYHLSINMGHIHPVLGAELVKRLLEQTVPPEVEEKHRVRVRELILGQEVKHLISYKKEVPIHFLEASARGESVTIYGVANSQSLVEAAIAAAREIPSIKEVKSAIQIVQEYNIMP